jgi:hypothetical protein
MLLINIVNNYFPAHKDKFYFQKEFLLNVQNAYALTMLLYLMRQLCHCVFYDQCADFMTFPQKFNYYLVFDTFLCDPQMYIHHIISFAFMYMYTRNFNIIGASHSSGIAFAITEISTLFLTIRAILRNYKRSHPYITTIYNINDKLFAITFFYTRIYLYYFKLLQNQEMYDLIIQFPPVEYHIFNISMHLLYFLNIYWAYKMIQTFVMPLLRRVAD